MFEHCVLPEGKFSERGIFGTKKTGYIKEDLEQMAKNYKEKRLHFEPILNIGHTDNKVGEVIDIQYKTVPICGLYVKMSLDTDGQNLLKNKKYKYLSGEVIHNHIDENGDDVGYVFHGVALTNHPRHKRMAKLYAEEVNDVEEKVLGEDFEIKYAELNLQHLQLKAELWKQKKLFLGHTPAAVEKFVKFYERFTEAELDFLLPDINNETLLTDQVYQKEEYATKEFSLQEIARQDLKRIKQGGEQNV